MSTRPFYITEEDIILFVKRLLSSLMQRRELPIT